MSADALTRLCEDWSSVADRMDHLYRELAELRDAARNVVWDERQMELFDYGRNAPWAR